MPQSDVSVFTAAGPLLVFGGPYSNLQATTEIFAEADRIGIAADHIVCTGDLAAYCADASAVIDLVRDRGCRVIAGNCDESLGADAGDCGCGFSAGSMCERLSAAWFQHATGTIRHDQRTWLASLPRRLDLLIGARRIAVMHGAPSRINRFVFASTPALAKRRELDLIDSDGLITGHCGLPFTQLVDGRLWHDAGAVGMPANDGTPDGWFSVISPEADGSLVISHRRLTYDWRAAAAAMARAGLPEDYRVALGSGRWPSCDVLPSRELHAGGRALVPGGATWPAGPVSRRGRRRSLTSHELWPAPEPVSPRLAPSKFQDALHTARGERRATVELERLDTLWFNTGTLCNITCRSCYIESSPRNDRLAYLTPKDVTRFLDEIEAQRLPTRDIGFTGGEPFLNPDMLALLDIVLSRGFDALVLTNAMVPMMRRRSGLLDFRARWGDRLRMRVSLDHFTVDRHEEERGPATFQPALEGLLWLARHGFHVSVAGRRMWGEDEAISRSGYQRLFDAHGIALDARDPSRLVLFPEMDAQADVPEITTACWDLLGKSPADVMCASSRMVVRRKGAAAASVVACTLLPYDPRFELGATLAEASRSVTLNHPHCARFCVLGGASCSASPASHPAVPALIERGQGQRSAS